MSLPAFTTAVKPWPKHSTRARLLRSAAIGTILVVAAVGPDRQLNSIARAASSTTTTCAGNDKAQASTTVSIAYSSTQEFNSNPQAAQWFAMLKKQFEAEHPHVTVKLVPIGGSYNDFVTKTNLMLRSPQTAPDVIHEGTQAVSAQVLARQIAPIDDCVAAWPDWKLFPTAVKYSGTPGPHFWQLTSGMNNFGLYYDVNYFKQAGLPVTWQPHTWADILSAARAIKNHVKSVTPLWLYAGNQVYDQTTRENFLDLLAGTRSPVTVGSKWVVKSSGLLDTFNFYNTVFSQGLGPSPSDLNNPQADGLLTGTLMPKQKVAIALVGSWAGSWWTAGGATPWSGALKAYKATPLPTEFGQAPGYVSQMQGSNFVLTSASAHKKLAFDLMAMAENHAFNLLHAEWCGEVPPRTDVTQDPKWLASTPYYNQQAASWVKYGTFTPSINYTTVATAVGQSTGEILASHISGQQALDEFSRRVTQVLDPSAVTITK